MPEVVYSIKELATRYDVSTETIRTWLRNGCPVVKQGTQGRGKKTLVSLKDIETWLAIKKLDHEILMTKRRIRAIQEQTLGISDV
jgi:transposase